MVTTRPPKTIVKPTALGPVANTDTKLPICGLFQKGRVLAQDAEQVPLLEDGGVEAFLRREVLPYAADAWYVPDSVKTGYEISFTRYFYKPKPMRTLEEIRADILAVEKETEGLLGDILNISGNKQ